MGNQDEIMFRPLTLEQCWTRAYVLLKQYHVLYLKIAAAIIGPISLFVLFIPIIPFTFDNVHFQSLEVVLLTLSILAANGPIMIATAEIYAGRRTTINDNDDWFQCITFYFSTKSPIRRQPILGRMILAGFLATVGVSLASILFYLPGIYLAVGWYFVPCIILFEKGGGTTGTTNSTIRTSFQRSWDLSSRKTPGKQQGASPWSIFWTLTMLFFLEFVPLLIIMIVSIIFWELTHDHAIFGHRVLANFIGFTLYAIPNIIHKCILIPYSIILKTVIYMNILVLTPNDGLTGDKFRSILEDNGLLLKEEKEEEEQSDDTKPLILEENSSSRDDGIQATERKASKSAIV